MAARVAVTMPTVALQHGELETDPWTQAQYADAMPHPEPCHECEQEGHVVTWRIHPRPGPFPPAGVRTELVQCCTCCAWSCGDESFVSRLEREKYDDRDVVIEQLVGGQWLLFHRRFREAS